MDVNELIISITEVMNRAAAAFIGIAVIVTLLVIFCSFIGRGDLEELKQLRSSCIKSGLLLWLIAWLII